MTTPRFLDRPILARVSRLAAALAASALLLAAQTRTAAPRPMPALKAVVEALEKGDGAAALRLLTPLKSQPTPIPDYLAYWEAQAHRLEKNHGLAVAAVQSIFGPGYLESPVTARAALLGAESLMDQQLPRQVMTLLLQIPAERMQQPGSFAVMARAQELNGDLVSAADFGSGSITAIR